jgi:prolyl oligopeptidase
MNIQQLLLFLIGLIMLSTVISCKQTPEEPKVVYPETRMDESVVDTLWGVPIADPYRWLEDDLSDETAQWVAAQNKVTFDYLDKIPYREALRQRLEKVWNYERISAPFKEGNYTYFYKNDGLQNQSVLWRQALDSDEPEIFLNPNTFSDDGTTSMAGVSFSKDGSLLAYQISEGGSDWRKVIIMESETKKILEDTLVDIKFSGISWYGNDGFYYSSYERPKGSELSAMTDRHKLLYHKLGTPQSADKLIFGGDQTPRRYIFGNVTEDQQYLVIGAAISTTGNELYIQDLRKPGSPIQPIVSNFDHSHQVVYTQGEQLYILTNLGAPNRKAVSVSLNKLNPTNWVDIIPETDMPLDVSSAGNFLFATYLRDAVSQVVQFDLTGKKIREIELPGIGTVGGFDAKMEDSILYYTFTNYIFPSTIFKYNIDKSASEMYMKPDVLFDPEMFESKQIFYTSKDGTKVPMIITHKKGLNMDGSNPTILYSYGGFNVSLRPAFSTATIVWLENGGIYAVPNIRGGGEYGKAWHDGGRLTQKQNVFDDFIAAAEYLIENKYTSSEKLAISGGSNGGLLVGACMTQRPELFQVALPAVGVMDMLRYHKFTAGAGWAYDYGTADESEEMFRYLLGYSPVHTLKDGVNYPATMVTTADHDDRVVPAHSFKFAARLQAATSNERPALIRIDVKAGHGAGKPTSMIIQERADLYAFTFYNMGYRTFNPVQ